jgi:hypothetical protein
MSAPPALNRTAGKRPARREPFAPSYARAATSRKIGPPAANALFRIGRRQGKP